MVLENITQIKINGIDITEMDFEGDVVWEKTTPVVDEHTILLLHAEDFTDSSQTNLQLTAGSGVSISNNGHFGKCFYIDTTDYEGGTALYAQNNSAFRFGTGDFTIDWWMKCDTPWVDHWGESSGIIVMETN